MSRIVMPPMDIVAPDDRPGAIMPAEQIAPDGATLAPLSPSGVASPAAQRPVSPRRASRTRKTDMPAAPAVTMPLAPLTRPDGTPAPVVHLVPELSPYARTGGLGEAGAG